MAEFGVTTIPGRAKGFVVYTSNEVEYVVTWHRYSREDCLCLSVFYDSL